LEVQRRSYRNAPASFQLDEKQGNSLFTLASPVQLELKATRAEVLGREPDGNPAFTRAALGQGQAYFLSLPIEDALTHTPGSFHGPQAQPFWKIYQTIAQPFLQKRVLTKNHPLVGVTEHPLDDRQRMVIMINYSPSPVEMDCKMAAGWILEETLYGHAPVESTGHLLCNINNNAALVLTVKGD